MQFTHFMYEFLKHPSEIGTVTQSPGSYDADNASVYTAFDILVQTCPKSTGHLRTSVIILTACQPDGNGFTTLRQFRCFDN